MTLRPHHPYLSALRQLQFPASANRSFYCISGFLIALAWTEESRRISFEFIVHIYICVPSVPITLPHAFFQPFVPSLPKRIRQSNGGPQPTMPSSSATSNQATFRWVPTMMLRVAVLITIIGTIVNQVQAGATVEPAFKVQSFAVGGHSSQKSLLTSKAKLDDDDDGVGGPTTDIDDEGDPSNQVSFENCSSDDYQVYGNVTSLSITPCQRANPDDPCTFVKGSNYTIRLEFTTSLSSQHPRSSVVACDNDGQYEYSAQSFNACKYSVCPIVANKPSAYVYHFQTLGSPFHHLTFNVTQDFFGPSMFCAGTSIHFQRSA